MFTEIVSFQSLLLMKTLIRLCRALNDKPQSQNINQSLLQELLAIFQKIHLS